MTEQTTDGRCRDAGAVPRRRSREGWGSTTPDPYPPRARAALDPPCAPGRGAHGIRFAPAHSAHRIRFAPARGARHAVRRSRLLLILRRPQAPGRGRSLVSKILSHLPHCLILLEDLLQTPVELFHDPPPEKGALRRRQLRHSLGQGFSVDPELSPASGLDIDLPAANIGNGVVHFLQTTGADSCPFQLDQRSIDGVGREAG